MKSITNEQLFTEITAEEAAKVNGGGFFGGFVDFWRKVWRAGNTPSPYLPRR
ncbi:hypothetical protein [Nostoc sp.]|uniref:hypothetical protein n=1 Tax=Nostoc sp. TaxID=1180 RepID=UPI002FFA0BA5